jgi:DNA-binding NtrC family response regulator
MTATILVVDDEPDLQALVLQKFRKQIRGGAVTFVFAHDGIEALQSIADHPDVDMVVSDINMPRMDGLSLLQKLQEAEDRKSTIIVSAYGDMSNIRTAMNRGAFDFLTKPIDFGDLEMTIDKTIRHVEMMREARRRQAEAERAHASLSRYFSPQIASRLAAASESNGMEVHRREVATLHRYRRLHLAGGNRDPRSARLAAQRICRRHDRRGLCAGGHGRKDHR